MRFVLKLKHSTADRYEHAVGASTASAVEAFTDADRQRYARLRELARVTVDERSTTWIAVVADAAASEALRSDVLSALCNGRPAAADARSTAGLLALWNDLRHLLSLALLNQLDSTLRVRLGSTFEASDDRARVWVAALFEPTPINLVTNNLSLFVVKDLLLKKSDVVGPAAIGVIGDARWPARCSSPTNRSSCRTPRGNRRCRRTSRARAFVSKQAWPIRLAANDLTSCLTMSPRVRTFVPDAAVIAAIRQAIADMVAIDTADPQAKSAARELRAAANAIAAATTTTP